MMTNLNKIRLTKTKMFNFTRTGINQNVNIPGEIVLPFLNLKLIYTSIHVFSVYTAADLYVMQLVPHAWYINWFHVNGTSPGSVCTVH